MTERKRRIGPRTVAAITVLGMAGLGATTIETQATAPCKPIPDHRTLYSCSANPDFTYGQLVKIQPVEDGNYRVDVLRRPGGLSPVREPDAVIPAAQTTPGSTNEILGPKNGLVVEFGSPTATEPSITVQEQYSQTLFNRLTS
ncbi:MAG: hypothetical protein H0W89_04825 [Candidatus Levybacteria bacterium]|nr:hypothetical protein [Candidatus Levybacteria bacterium]